MRNADELLRSGDLDGARAALVEAVRSAPGDVPTRMFLFSLLAIGGEWDKARSQLSTLATLSPEAQMLSVVYGQAIEAEREREAVWAGTASARQHVASHWAEALLTSISHLGRDEHDAVAAARDAAFDAAPDMPGTLDGQTFDWIADADTRFGPSFEAIIGGKYGLQAFDQVASITSEGPRDLRDLVWYPVQIAFRGGQSVAALLPVRYPGIAEDPAERLARATSWRDCGSGEQGSGQHIWMTSNGDDCELLAVRHLQFD
jgi:protein involved in temperature-dependent protein secretion